MLAFSFFSFHLFLLNFQFDTLAQISTLNASVSNCEQLNFRSSRSFVMEEFNATIDRILSICMIVFAACMCVFTRFFSSLFPSLSLSLPSFDYFCCPRQLYGSTFLDIRAYTWRTNEKHKIQSYFFEIFHLFINKCYAAEHDDRAALLFSFLSIVARTFVFILAYFFRHSLFRNIYNKYVVCNKKYMFNCLEANEAFSFSCEAALNTHSRISEEERAIKCQTCCPQNRLPRICYSACAHTIYDDRT